MHADHPRSRGVYWSASTVFSSGCGSSPLARGLHPPLLLRVHPRRIIPARAGFTSKGAASSAATRDHPRSRGVYSSTSPAIPKGKGSSPLARGLPQALPPGFELPGIIPARAGFTNRVTPVPSSTRDHPRSRGVYRDVVLVGLGAHGSSPLARGLRQVEVHRVRGQGIIPARAGFTLGRVRRDVGDEDHPRSRGVYSNCGISTRTSLGSSPLARGLRRRGHHLRVHRRIIPARAGFTAVRG